MMPSDWAIAKAQGVISPLKDRIYRELSAANYDNAWDRIADALDAARAQGRREGLEEVAHIALSVAARINDKCERMAKGADLVSAEIHSAIAKEPKA